LLSGALAVCAIVATAPDASAIRPFITDDARVVGGAHVQLETWWRRDRESFHHWAVGAFGPNDHVEISLGAVHGLAGGLEGAPGRYAIGGPVLQGKFLLSEAKETSWPGLAFVAGVLPPFGRGGFEPPGWSGFGYVAATESIDAERLLVHANVGFSAIDAPPLRPLQFTWGVGMQVRTVEEFHLIGELFSGDPYAAGVSGAAQWGFRYIFNDHLQLDGTLGSGVFGERKLPLWASSGVRLVTHELW
jgi:hypothetical protein